MSKEFWKVNDESHFTSMQILEEEMSLVSFYTWVQSEFIKPVLLSFCAWTKNNFA